eukprot:CAMPEP_0119049654 /NCGR_PEP_ID=MMETSP1177-20130426/65761_1 /TAXON_ID=2985 /ORGANISM="Ochromonas sp, Strain CCMP1899" /LENGTH=69 /DNA_ID=CAMNT_0007027159 /DNA_START=1345 /DNA_END=1554 /DNA_ORIENTATION=+
MANGVASPREQGQEIITTDIAKSMAKSNGSPYSSTNQSLGILCNQARAAQVRKVKRDKHITVGVNMPAI